MLLNPTKSYLPQDANYWPGKRSLLAGNSFHANLNTRLMFCVSCTGLCGTCTLCLMVLLLSSELHFNMITTPLVPSFHFLDLITWYMTVTVQRMKLKTFQFVLLRIGVTILFYFFDSPITTSKKCLFAWTNKDYFRPDQKTMWSTRSGRTKLFGPLLRQED